VHLYRIRDHHQTLFFQGTESRLVKVSDNFLLFELFFIIRRIDAQ